jgi:hypothetical protein
VALLKVPFESVRKLFDFFIFLSPFIHIFQILAVNSREQLGNLGDFSFDLNVSKKCIFSIQMPPNMVSAE